MKSLRYQWKSAEGEHSLELVYVRGTESQPFLFGEGNARRSIEIRGFFLATIPVTQALWAHVVGSDTKPAGRRGANLPVENISWNTITGPDGFLRRINSSPVVATMTQQILSGDGGTGR